MAGIKTKDVFIGHLNLATILPSSYLIYALKGSNRILEKYQIMYDGEPGWWMKLQKASRFKKRLLKE